MRISDRLPGSLATAVATVLAVAAVPPATASTWSLQSADVPALCGAPAGHLVDGVLPNTAAEYETVALNPQATSHGHLRHHPGRVTAAVLTCSSNSGHLAYPDQLIVYSASGAVLGSYQLPTFGDTSTPSIIRTRLKHGALTADVDGIVQPGDLASGPSLSATFTFAWKRHANRLSVRSIKSYPETPLALRLLHAVKSRKARKVRKYLSRTDAATILRDTKGASSVTFKGCYGQLDTMWAYTPPGDQALRACMLTVISGPAEWLEVIDFDPRTWNTWAASNPEAVG